MAAGPFTYEVRAAGASPESAPAIQVKGRLDAGKAYTVAAVGRRDQLQGLLLRDDMAPSAPGRGKVRFLDAAFDLPAVDDEGCGIGQLAEEVGLGGVGGDHHRPLVRRGEAGHVIRPARQLVGAADDVAQVGLGDAGAGPRIAGALDRVHAAVARYASLDRAGFSRRGRGGRLRFFSPRRLRPLSLMPGPARRRDPGIPTLRPKRRLDDRVFARS